VEKKASKGDSHLLGIDDKIPKNLLDQIMTEIKYSGYIARKQAAIAETLRHEAKPLPPALITLRLKGCAKRPKHHGRTIGISQNYSSFNLWANKFLVGPPFRCMALFGF